MRFHILTEELDFVFNSWKNVIQPVKPRLEMIYRLGSSEVILQELDRRATPTNSIATVAFSNIESMNAFVKDLSTAIGKSATFLDEKNALTIDPIFLLDFTYGFQKVDGTPAEPQQQINPLAPQPTSTPSSTSFLCTFNLTLISDTWDL